MLSHVELFETLILLFALRCSGCVAWDFLLDVKVSLRPATCWLVMSGKEILEYAGFFDPTHGDANEASLILDFETHLFSVLNEDVLCLFRQMWNGFESSN